MNRFILLTATFVFTACAGVKGMMGVAIQTYSGPAKPDAEVSTLVFQTVAWSTRGKANASLSKLDGVVYGSEAQGFGVLAKTLPGKHALEVRCYVAGLVATLDMKIEVEAGKSYEISCIDDQSGIARAEYKLAAPVAPK